MATEIAKAYVQIVPSAQGIKGAITKELGGEAAEAGKQGGEQLGANLVGMMKKAIAAAGIGAFIKSSLDAAGNIQQSFGGLDTLYGSASDRLKEYAAEAAKFGVDSNTYAEQAVSFGAALKEAYGGDTVKAAEAANAAIQAIADNSAKMGTDIESVQAAYQGFAKGQYTLLDNLKLGYGGTKSEMERLLADAEAFSGVHYDINNLGDVYSAIGAIQEKLELAGVAADEAKTTFSGSFGAMSASWTNFIASLSLGEGIQPALQQLITSASTFFFGNFLPLIVNLVSQIPTVIVTAVPLLIQAVQDALMQISALISTDSVNGGFEMVNGLIQGVMQNLPQMITTAGETVFRFVDGLLSQMPQLITTAGQMIAEFVGGIAAALPSVINSANDVMVRFLDGMRQRIPEMIVAAGQAISQFLGAVLSNLPAIVDSGINLIQNWINGMNQNKQAILNAIVDAIKNILSTIVSNLPQIIESGIKILASLAAGIVQGIPQAIAAIVGLVGKIGIEFTKVDWGKVGRDILEGIAKGLTGGLGIIVDAAKKAAKSALDAAKNFLGIHSPSTVFRDQVGEMMAEGMAVGFEDNVPTAEIQNALTPMTTVVPDAVVGNSSAYSYGGFTINVYGAAGQSETALVDIIEQRINERIMNRQAVFA